MPGTAPPVRAILLDIEGTTTPIAFVQEVLFPFARARLAGFLTASRDSRDAQHAVEQLTTEHLAEVERGETPPPLAERHAAFFLQSVATYATWLTDRDRKSPGLKLLQGLIWERGYRAGELHGQVYPDVPPAIRRWRDAGLRVAIYSSGSELAQRLLFGSTEYGDLTALFAGFFDTAVGAKVSADSYRKIADALDLLPARILFVSDITRELDAAAAAGMQVTLSVRPGNPPAPPHAFPVIMTFNDLVLANAGTKA